MENRVVGMLIIGIAVFIGIIISLFNKALNEIVGTSCTEGLSCPMWKSIAFQTNVSIGIMSFVVLIGLYLIFFGKEVQTITKTVKEQIDPKKITKDNYKQIIDGLTNDEKAVFEKVIESEGTAFQSDLVDKTQFHKVKVTRILDKLEGKGLIERKRRGMTNVVILKQ
ncbi:MarR family transcriptional regulator [Candidatus Woesearchaeota archaeon]|nr:MarR family transcriptional regulator [Candidatus Woesearchaeota archaeon]